MKFNCGETREEKRERLREIESQWHNWFAWYPVRVGSNECRWLETVERKRHYISRVEYKFDYRGW